MTERRLIALDGNEAVASVAHRTNEVIAHLSDHPVLEHGRMGRRVVRQGDEEHLGERPRGRRNAVGGGPAGAVHGALQAGALATTFTAAQGLLLMIPNMYKIAGELTSYCMHRGGPDGRHARPLDLRDHSDVMACRQTGFAMLCSNSVQEAHDLAAIGQMATLKSRIPVLHFFDGFRTSHEVSKIEELTDEDLLDLLDPAGHRRPQGARPLARPPGPPRIRPEHRTPSSRPARRATAGTPPPPGSSSRRWTGSRRGPAGPTASSTTSAS